MKTISHICIIICTIYLQTSSSLAYDLKKDVDLSKMIDSSASDVRRTFLEDRHLNALINSGKVLIVGGNPVGDRAGGVTLGDARIVHAFEPAVVSKLLKEFDQAVLEKADGATDVGAAIIKDLLIITRDGLAFIKDDSRTLDELLTVELMPGDVIVVLLRSGY